MDALTDQIGAAIGGIFELPLVRLFLAGIAAYAVVLWLACAFWVLQDMRRRTTDTVTPFVAAGAVVLASPVLFPLALVVYRIVRPGETLAETRERVLSEQLDALQADIALGCPACGTAVEEDWLACPACRMRLAHRCAACGRSMGLDWSLCAWCGAEFGEHVVAERIARTERPPVWTGSERRQLERGPARVVDAGA